MFQEALDNIIEVKQGEVRIFDWKEYSKRYIDLLKANIVTRRELTWHMIHHGQYNNRILLDIDGNRYDHVFKKDVYEKKINQKFATDEGAYMHYCDHNKDTTLVCEQLKIKYKYLQSYTGDLSLDGAKRIVMNYKTILEVRQHEQNNISFKNMCIDLYNKNDIKSTLGDSNILYGSSKVIHSSNDIREIIMDNSTKKRLDNVLVNIHSNLNHTSGDTIMLLEYIKLFQKYSNTVTLITEYKVEQLFRSNLDLTNIKLVENMEPFSYIETHHNKHDLIFLRNHNTNDKMIGKPYLNKTVLYGLDIHLETITKMKNTFLFVVTQSEKIKQKYIDKDITDDKIIVKEPHAVKYDFDLPDRTDNEIRLIYCGTLRDEENILEIIEEFQKIHKDRPEVVLKIVYGKIMNTNADFEKKVNECIKNGVDGIMFKHNLSHKDACYEIATSDIGICWRKNGWGDNGEVSTKVKEYEMYGVEIMNKKLTINNEIIFYKHDLKIKMKSKIVKYVPFKNSTDILDYVKNTTIKYDYFNIITQDLHCSNIKINNINLLYFVYTFYPEHKSGYTSRTENTCSFLKRNNILFNIIVNPFNYNYTSIHNIDKYIVFPYLNEAKFTYLSNICKILYHLYNYHTLIGASNHTIGNSISKLKGYYNIKTTYEVRGLWYITRYQRTNILNYDEENAEINACNNNDRVFVLNNTLKQYLITKGVNKDKIYIVKNSFNVEKNKSIKSEYKYFFGYFGSLVDYENLNEILFCINYLKNNFNINLTGIIIGKGECVIDLDNYIKKNQLSITLINDTIPKEQIMLYYNQVKCIVLPRRKNVLTNIVGPLKFVEAYSNNKIIIANDLEPLYDYIPNEEIPLRNSNIFLYNTTFTLIETCKYIYNNNIDSTKINKFYNSDSHALKMFLPNYDNFYKSNKSNKSNFLFFICRNLYEDLNKNAGYIILIKNWLNALNKQYNLIITHIDTNNKGPFFICDNVYSIKDKNNNLDYDLLENIIKKHNVNYFMTDSNILNTDYDLVIDIDKICDINKKYGLTTTFFERGLSFLVYEYKRPQFFKENFHIFCEKAKSIYDKFDTLTCLSNSTNDFIKKYIKPDNSNITVVYNYTLPLKIFTQLQKDEVKSIYNISSDEIIISYIGNIVSYENLDLLLDTFNKNINFFKQNKVKLMILGS